MNGDQYIFKTRPRFAYLFILLLGAAFFGYICYLTLTSDLLIRGASKQVEQVITWLLAAMLLCLGLLCLFSIIGFKICYLTAYELIINEPLTRHKQRILIADIKELSQRNAKSYMPRGAFSRNMFKIGQRATIMLYNGKTVTLSSLEIYGYNELIRNIRVLIQGDK